MEERRKDGGSRKNPVVLPWMRIYPDEVAVGQSAMETLASWHEHLPAPVTPTERALRRLIEARLMVLCREYLGKEHPELLEKLDKINQAFVSLTGKPAVPL